MKKTVYTKLAVAALTLSVLAGSALAQMPNQRTITPFTKKQTFCEVNRFTGAKREFTVKKWDATTQFDVFQAMSTGDLMDMSCAEVKLEKNTYCFANSKNCWVEYDIINFRVEKDVDKSAMVADIAEGAQE